MNTSNPAEPLNVTTTSEDKTVAILSYITLIGFIIAIVLHGSKKTRLGAFHLRQALGILLTGIACGVAQVILAFIPILGWLAILAIWVSLLLIWIFGLIAAAKGECKPAPVIGEYYQKWFAGAFD
jgi:uncharacterized membrane protein